AYEPTRVVVGLSERIPLWARTGRRDGTGVSSPLQMAAALAAHLPRRADGDEPQPPALAKGPRRHRHGAHPPEPPGAAAARGRGAGGGPRGTPPARGGHAAVALGGAPRAGGWAAPGSPHSAREGRGAGGAQLAVGICLEALQRHGPPGGIADEACHVVPPRRWHGCGGGEPQ